MTRFAVHNRVTALILGLFLFLFGLFSASQLPRESFPEVKKPLIFVNTIYPGASPEDIERVVTQKIEDKLEGVDGVSKVTSQSTEGVSAIQVEFAPSVDVETALRRTKDKVDQAKAELPKDAEDPMVAELNFSNIPVFVVSLYGDTEMERLEQIAERLEDDIKAVPGVLDVKISGKQTREVAIDCDPIQLKARGVTVDDVVKSIRNQHANIPGGVVRNGVNRFSVRVTGELDRWEEFADLVVRAENGNAVRIRDVATVGYQYVRERSTVSRLNGQPALTLSVTKRTGENIIKIVDATKELIDADRKTWPQGTLVDYTFDQSKEIRHMVDELFNHIILGVIFVVLVLAFFLGVRNSFFISTAIPLSMMLGFLVLHMMGVTLNMVVLFSLVIALGMLVDDGIVVVENIYRHYTMGKSRLQAAIEGTKEVAIPVTTATITTISAFIPIIWMPGIMGQFMKYLPITVCVTLVGSLFVAFVINPVFASLFMTKKDFGEHGEDGTFFGKVKKGYGVLIERLVNRPIIVTLMILGFVGGGIAAYGVLGSGASFFPAAEPKVVAIEIEGPLGQELMITDSALSVIEKAVLAMPDSLASINSVTAISGRGKSDMDFGGPGTEPNKGYLDIGFVDYDKRDVNSFKSMAWFEANLPDLLPGWNVKVKQQQEGPPQGKPVEFDLKGADYASIGPMADKIVEDLSKLKMLTNVQHNYDPASPEIMVVVDRSNAEQMGISNSQVAQAVRGALFGVEAAKFRMDGEEYDVMVRLHPESRERIEGLQDIVITHEGRHIPLSSVATLEQKANLTSINHVGGTRTIQITGELAPGETDQAKAKAEAQKIIDEIVLADGISISKGSGNIEEEETTRFLGVAFLVAVGLVFFTMVAQFNSVYQPLLVLIGVFLGIGGVFWGLLIVDVQFSIIMSGIGIISLAGVVAKNSIVLIDFINHLRREGYDLRTAVIEGGKTRLRPVVLTACTAMIGLLPMATGMGYDFVNVLGSLMGSGHGVANGGFILKSESSLWWSPMAWSIFWGLLFNTILVLIVTPTFYYSWYRFLEILSEKWNRRIAKAGFTKFEDSVDASSKNH